MVTNRQRARADFKRVTTDQMIGNFHNFGRELFGQKVEFWKFHWKVISN